MGSVFPNDRVENLAAANTPPSPEREPRPVIFLFDHPSPTTMALHDGLLGKKNGKARKVEEPPSSPRNTAKRLSFTP